MSNNTAHAYQYNIIGFIGSGGAFNFFLRVFISITVATSAPLSGMRRSAVTAPAVGTRSRRSRGNPANTPCAPCDSNSRVRARNPDTRSLRRSPPERWLPAVRSEVQVFSKSRSTTPSVAAFRSVLVSVEGKVYSVPGVIASKFYLETSKRINGFGLYPTIVKSRWVKSSILSLPSVLSRSHGNLSGVRVNCNSSPST